MTSHYLRTGEILSPERVSEMERFYLPYLTVKPENKKKLSHLVVGVPLKTTLSCASSEEEMNQYLSLLDGENYVVSSCIQKQGFYRSLVNHERRKQRIIGVSLKEAAT